MSLSKVRAAMIQGFVAADIGLTHASENKKFTPPANAAWAELIYMPGIPVMATIGERGMDQMNGYLQVNINVPLNTGTQASMAAADLLRGYFYGGRVLEHEGQHVRVMTVGTKPGFPVDNCFKTPTLITFYAQFPRTTLGVAPIPVNAVLNEDGSPVLND